jgi:endonuclease/exonuclease/phosphatase family metal-dependent hydrolase
MSYVCIGIWNAEYRSPRTTAGQRITRILMDLQADVLCLTEATAALLPSDGHVICSEADYGYTHSGERRKVLLWSRTGWSDVDTIGSSRLPGGRFVSGRTYTPYGPLQVLGVCIPWAAAHVSTGRRDRQRWQDHLTYLDELASLIRRYASDGRLIVVGDYNQRVPRARQPQHVFASLQRAFMGLTIATKGSLRGTDQQAIDHLAHTSDLCTHAVSSWGTTTDDGLRLTDHTGVVVRLGLNS